MKEFLDRMRNGGDDEEVELSPAGEPGDDDAADRAAGRLRDEVASSTGSEVELSDAGSEAEAERSDGVSDAVDDTKDAGTGVGAGMLPGTGTDPDEQTDPGSSRTGSGSMDEASIERVVEQNERIISLLERLVGETDAIQEDGPGNDETDSGATPQSLW